MRLNFINLHNIGAVRPRVQRNDRIARTMAHFPAQSEAFFHQLTEGQSFQVGCGGLNESTTVRTKK